MPVTAGDLVVTGVDGTTASAEVLDAARRGRLAGVILMPPNIRDARQVRALVDALQRAAARGGRPPLLVMIDQEGGTVTRLAGAHPTASAAVMGTRTLSAIRAEGRRTAADLRAAGVNVDLAPVADVGTSGGMLGSRTFAADPAVVAGAACAFARGLRDGGVVPTLKHFPGLGTATVNTDLAPVSLDVSRADLVTGTAAYRRCGGEPATLVMVASAAYPAVGGDVPAVLSPAAYRFAAGMGVRGPFITDSLDAAAVRDIDRLPERAVLAGAGLVLYTGRATGTAGWRSLAAAVRAGRIPPATLRARAMAVRALRSGLPVSPP
ncbi:MAG: glycoside hydrolase family 3 N-terminal domain-containing protein [Thermoleophilia bacterium]